MADQFSEFHTAKTQDELDVYFMSRAVQLATSRRSVVSPNPPVGALVVCDGRILGEGATSYDGGPHAEVLAIRTAEASFPELLSCSTLYVTLEPCSITGRTPPCADLIVTKKLARVVVGCLDFTPGVSGRGLERLRNAGINVRLGVCQNKTFALAQPRHVFTQLQRPYIILKQAVCAAGFVGSRQLQLPITGSMANTLSHQWRAEVDAILIGVGTLLTDQPSLTTRHVDGPSPLRIVLNLASTPLTQRPFRDSSSPWLLASVVPEPCVADLPQHSLLLRPDCPLEHLFEALVDRRVGTLLVEGGPNTLAQFVRSKAWDEYRKWTSTTTNLSTQPKTIRTLDVSAQLERTRTFGPDVLQQYRPHPSFEGTC